MGVRVMDGDEAFYYLHEDGYFKGMVLIHIDDFNLAGTAKFVEEVLEIVDQQLTVSKVERDKFRFTGIDINAVEHGIKVEMDDYMNSGKDIKDIRKGERRDEELTKLEMKEYRKVTRKVSWLANSTRPDLSYTAL